MGCVCLLWLLSVVKNSERDMTAEQNCAKPVKREGISLLNIRHFQHHPRPDWARSWVDLNGSWRFDFDPQDVGVHERWFDQHTFSRTIQIPYPWQSVLSGVHDPAYQRAAWYEREVTIPEDFDQRVFLVFGAIDWHATVWVDGNRVAEHEGGYTPFEVELTGLAKPGGTARVTVRAYDVTDPETPNGKQTGWYTPTGGIWQTVYLEPRGQSYLRQAHIAPDVDKGQASIRCIIEAAQAGEFRLQVRSRPERDGKRLRHAATVEAGQVVRLERGPNAVQLLLPVTEPLLWSPDSPTLYTTDIQLLSEGHGREKPRVEDVVRTYFGMRKISHGPYAASDHEYILLNDKPIYLRGALHQSFNPQGIYTHPDDDFMRRDYEKAKEFGLNFIRIHIKVEEPRALYWADRLGVMLMCDMPNFQRKTPRAKHLWEQTLRSAIARDFNHPAIIAWCNFNETWGIGDGGYDKDTQLWVRDMYLLAKELDPTRLVEDNSPCYYDHVVTDINSWHFYIDRYEKAKSHIEDVVANTFPGSSFNYVEGWKQTSVPLINSEYGGVGAGSGDRDISWVFLFLTNLLRKQEKVCGYVYTELEDIEWEHNGFMNYDRSDKFYGYPAGITLADLQGEEFPVLDCPPYQRVEAGSRIRIPVLLSHWSERKGLKMRLSADGLTVDGRPWSCWIAPEERKVLAKPFTVTPVGDFDIALPDANGLLNIVVEVLARNKRLGANYCVLDVRGAASWSESNQYAVSFPVNSFSTFTFDPALLAAFSERPGKIFGHKTGYVEYHLRLPEDLHADDIIACRLMAEIGSKADVERLDWPARRHRDDCPQTDGRAWPSDVTISINGAPCAVVRVPNEFADARGVLSHVAHYHHGSSGVLADVVFDDAALASVKKSLACNRMVTLRFEVAPDAKHQGGVALYGNDMGAWPSDPTLVFTLKPGMPKPKGKIEPRTL